MSDEYDLDDAAGYPVPTDLDPDAVEPLAGAADANRMLRRLRSAIRARKGVIEVAAADIANTTAWRDRRVAGIDSTIAWAERSLEGWLRATHKAGGPKSATLPAGTVRLRKAPVRIVVPPTATPADEAAWAAFAERHADEGVESPVTVTRKFGAAAMGKVVKPGPEAGVDADSGYKVHKAVDIEGAEVPGVFVLVSPVDGFSYTPAVAEVDLEAEVPDEATA